MLSGRRFIAFGLNHLTARVATSLVEQGARVVVIGDPDADDDARESADQLNERCRIVDPGFDRDHALVDAGIAGAAGLLLLGGDDLENLRTAAAAHSLAPDVPVVMRTFQPELVDEVSEQFNIRRAYSVAALAAPTFVGAAFGEDVIQTLRLGDEEVPLCVLEVGPVSPVVGKSAEEVKEAFECAVVAVSSGADRWKAVSDSVEPIVAGDRVLVGGRQVDVLRLAMVNDPSVGVSSPAKRRRSAAGRSGATTTPRAVLPRLLLFGLVLFVLFFLANVTINLTVLDLAFLDALLAALATSLGNVPPVAEQTWVKVFHLGAMAAGVVLPWIVLSYITALVLAERLELRMAKRALRMEDHVVLIGLGRVGYRVAQLLAELNIPTVVMENEPDSSFLEAIATDLPVLRGDGRLPENLERCNIARARCVIACSDDDLANLATCREARRLQPRIRTVLRAFDETVAGRLAEAFAIDVTLSSTTVASRAFVGAAIDEYAMRPLTMGGLELAAFRFTPNQTITPDGLARWRKKGMRVLALDHEGEIVPPTVALYRSIEAGDEAIVVGPVSLIRELAEAY